MPAGRPRAPALPFPAHKTPTSSSATVRCSVREGTWLHSQTSGSDAAVRRSHLEGAPVGPALEGPGGAGRKSTESSPLELLAPPSSAGLAVAPSCGSNADDSNALAMIPLLGDGAGRQMAAVGELEADDEPLRPMKAAHAVHWQHATPHLLAIKMPAPIMIAATNPTATRIQLMFPAAHAIELAGEAATSTRPSQGTDAQPMCNYHARHKIRGSVLPLIAPSRLLVC